MNQIFFLFSNTAMRRTAISSHADSPDRYSLMGYDAIIRKGFKLKNNIDGNDISKFGRSINFLINKISFVFFGDGGDFYTTFKYLFEINRSTIVLTASDRMGVPIAILRYLKLIRAKHLYTSIGLPVHFSSLHDRYKKRKRLISVLTKIDIIICFSGAEKNQLKALLGDVPKVVFFKYFVDTEVFKPMPSKYTYDIISVGADNNRNIDFIISYAEYHCDINILMVLGNSNFMALPNNIPSNIKILVDIPLTEVLAYIQKSKIVLLPVKQNIYSGATTTLLQSMSMEKAVVVSNVLALDEYGLVDEKNCLMFAPGDFYEMQDKVNYLLNNQDIRKSIEEEARKFVVDKLDITFFVSNIMKILIDLDCYSDIKTL